jgi:hypothetical protein
MHATLQMHAIYLRRIHSIINTSMLKEGHELLLRIMLLTAEVINCSFYYLVQKKSGLAQAKIHTR